MSKVELDNLTTEEKEIIQKHRDKKAQQRAAEDFHSKAIATAYKWDLWSKDNGEGLTFTTFVNTFGYQDEDGKQMYKAVKRIFDAAWPEN